jgi:hypothetical protein
MKAVQDLAPRREPMGRLVNRPIPVEDDLDAIVRALGIDPATLKRSKPAPRPGAGGVPIAEF